MSKDKYVPVQEDLHTDIKLLSVKQKRPLREVVAELLRQALGMQQKNGDKKTEDDND